MKVNNHQKQNKPIVYRIDAKGRPIGRVASEIALSVQGKLLPTYSPEKLANVIIVVKNIKEIMITEKKMKEKKYYRYTGYPGGIKMKRLEELFKVNPEKFLLRVTTNMLPKNKLRARMLKKICFTKNK